MRYKELCRHTLLIVCALVIGACGGGGGGGGASPFGESPNGIRLVITSPASAGYMETPDRSVILQGTASGSNAIASVKWRNDRGGKGKASGTSSWKTGGITLRPGENTITVVAEDSAGETGSLTIVIKRESGGKGAVSLSWTAPTTRNDGSALTNLAGYYIRYGRMSEIYDYEIEIDNPSVLSYLVEDLQPGTWYFAATAYDTNGIESDFSNEIERIVE